MEEHILHFFNGVFYQVMEFIVAPALLVIYTNIVLKKEKDTEEYSVGRLKRDDSDELNFVAIFSGILYYFSLKAHSDHEHSCMIDCIIMKSQSCIFIILIIEFFLIITYKNRNQEFLNIRPNKAILIVSKSIWMVIFSLLIFFIFVINAHENNIILIFNFKHIFESISLICFYFNPTNNPDNFICFVALIIIGYIYFTLFRNPEVRIILDYQASHIYDGGLNNKKKKKEMYKLKKLAQNANLPNAIRFFAFFNASRYQYELIDSEESFFEFLHRWLKCFRKDTSKKNYYLNRALELVSSAKKVGISMNMPEEQMLPIRQFKIRLDTSLSDCAAAVVEISELEQQLNDTDSYKKIMLVLFINKLKETYNQNRGNCPELE